MRLRYGGSAARWGFGIYPVSKESVLPTGVFAGAPEDALATVWPLPGRPTGWIWTPDERTSDTTQGATHELFYLLS
jgi:hypothetical protein